MYGMFCKHTMMCTAFCVLVCFSQRLNIKSCWLTFGQYSDFTTTDFKQHF